MADFWPWLAGVLGMSILLWGIYWIIGSDRPVVREFVYKKTPQTDLTIRLYLPGNWAPRDKRPAILFFFGGGWINGSINHFRWQADQLAREGIIAALVDYRVDSRHHTTPDQAVADGFDAFSWLIRHADDFGIDTHRLISSGSSAGGHIAACLALCPPLQQTPAPTVRPALMVLFNPVMDLTNATPELEFSTREMELIAMMPNETIAAISPNQHVGKHTPPTLLIFGSLDPLSLQGAQFSQLAAAVGVKTQTRTVTGERHGFFNQEPWRSGTMKFLKEYLREQGYLEF
ncbi:MAG: alpha/beta hydrolase [Porticoccaceae bacterium]